MNPTHPLTVEADDGVEVLFACPVEGCGRRVVVSRLGRLTVLQQGDFFAFHSGGTAGLELSTSLVR
jgi:hypothetical protein